MRRRAPIVEFESETLRRNEALRQRDQLPRDVQELRFRPVWTDELYADGQSILRRAERHDQRWMAARVERLNVGPAVLVVRRSAPSKSSRLPTLQRLNAGPKATGASSTSWLSKKRSMSSTHTRFTPSAAAYSCVFILSARRRSPTRSGAPVRGAHQTGA